MGFRGSGSRGFYGIAEYLCGLLEFDASGIDSFRKLWLIRIRGNDRIARARDRGWRWSKREVVSGSRGNERGESRPLIPAKPAGMDNHEMTTLDTAAVLSFSR